MNWNDNSTDNKNVSILEIYNDNFKNELTIKSLHINLFGVLKDYAHELGFEDLKDACVAYDALDDLNKDDYEPGMIVIGETLPCVPIDVMYKSNPIEEKLYIIYCDRSESNNLIWNIDGRKNIKLTRKEGLPKNHYEITREQLYELCMAKSLRLQINGQEDVLKECYAAELAEFLPYLQAVYHEAIDNTMFPDAKNNAQLYVEDKIREGKESIRKEKERTDERDIQIKAETEAEWKKNRDRIIWMAIIVAVLTLLCIILPMLLVR